MRLKLFVTVLFLSMLLNITAQDTFSIVAVDTITGEVGSAGASCLDNSAITGGAVIISDIIPGRGAIHTQSYWVSANQINAHNKMLEGLSPAEIIDWLVENDVQNQPQRRQYGIVDFDEEGNARSAAFTGTSCMDWKGHHEGVNYSIQGNILLGQQIIDSMESRFVNTSGTLADKLMAALQGANVVGADSRCTPEGVSSLSAFLRVAKPENDPDSLYLDLNVAETPYGVEPIDELQVLYDEWLNWVSVNNPDAESKALKLYPNPAKNFIHYQINRADLELSIALQMTDLQGRMVNEMPVDKRFGRMDISGIENGLYVVSLLIDGKKTENIKIVIDR
jgi:uncharacterized Ntn-hydrolase superfamily protein